MVLLGFTFTFLPPLQTAPASPPLREEKPRAAICWGPCQRKQSPFSHRCFTLSTQDQDLSLV